MNIFNKFKKKKDFSNTRETQVGPNSFRINVVKKGAEADAIKPKFSYSEQFLSRKEARKAAAREESKKFDAKSIRNSYGDDDYYNDYDIAYGYGSSYRPRAYSSYTPPVVKKEFAWTETRWQNYNIYSVFGNSDDNSQLLIKEPEGYLTPSFEEIRGVLHIYSIKEINMVKELCRLLYFKMLDEHNYINHDSERYLSSGDLAHKINLYEQAFNNYIPGFTPLEQAVNFYQKYKDLEAINNAKQEDNSRSETIVNFKREDFTDPALNSQIDLNPLSKNKKIEILNKISLVGKLGQQFEIEKETGEKLVSNSDVYRKKVMRDYSQLDRVNIYQRAFPNFNIKFLTKDLIVDVPVKTSEKKQKIIILLDYSGSMNEQKKQIWVNALLMDRFRYVIRGEAEVYFSYFVYNPNDLKFKHIKNEKDVKDFWNTFSNYPSGGCTDMGRIVKSIATQVHNGTFFNLKLDLSREKPEILIINDGQDSVGAHSFPYKVNAISLMQYSSELKNLCIETGGKQVQINSSNVVTCYSKEKIENINIL